MENEVRLIDANALDPELQKVVKEYKSNGAYESLCRLRSAPTIDPESLRPRGRWVSNYYKITCSSCNHSVFLGTKDPVCHKAEKENFKFCPNCGADMRGDGQ